MLIYQNVNADPNDNTSTIQKCHYNIFGLPQVPTQVPVMLTPLVLENFNGEEEEEEEGLEEEEAKPETEEEFEEEMVPHDE